jgi:hypothetical protein
VLRMALQGRRSARRITRMDDPSVNASWSNRPRSRPLDSPRATSAGREPEVVRVAVAGRAVGLPRSRRPGPVVVVPVCVRGFVKNWACNSSRAAGVDVGVLCACWERVGVIRDLEQGAETLKPKT